jgi:hypothetical protein
MLASLREDDMRIITPVFAVMVLSECASIANDDSSQWQALSAEAIAGLSPDVIRIAGVHGFMLNTHWTAVTPEARYGCMRDLTGAPTCEERN